MSKILVWFRQDLRIEDNPALAWAAEQGDVLPLYILEDEHGLGRASMWWLYHSLHALKKDLPQLLIKRGRPELIIRALIKQHAIGQVVWNRRYTPVGCATDIELKANLQGDGINVKSFNSHLLYEPWEIANKDGKPFKVFTPFWKACLASKDPALPSLVNHVAWIAHSEKDDDVSDLLPQGYDWAKGIQEAWVPGEQGAKKRLDRFIEQHLQYYARGRDFLWPCHTSRLSPHLQFGEISPRAVWYKIQSAKASGEDKNKFLSEMGWREFSYHLLYHFPSLPDQSLRPEFAKFPWLDDPIALKAWQKGRTGIPIVDAAMKELWATGYMHNRARMIVASFLTKHLLIPWQRGAAWFWDTLVDADLANNSASWQWVAGCGADAAPYFRVFNPVLQGQRFDPNGDYVRHWIPELAGQPAKIIHEPGQENYIKPIIDLKVGRTRALQAFEKIKKT